MPVQEGRHLKVTKPALTPKMLGDAGEHYALSQFAFAGLPVAKMPDGWEGYDLAVESGTGLLRVSVKTRNQTDKWDAGAWFTFDDRKVCNWYVFVFRTNTGTVRSWVIPFDLALLHANQPTTKNKTPWIRDISWTKLNKPPLLAYENNWQLITTPGPVVAP